VDIVDVQTVWQCGMKTVSVSTDGGKTWKTLEGKAGGMGCIMAFADAKTGWLGFGDKFEMTADGGQTWKPLALPQGVAKVAAVSLRTPAEGYLLDDAGVLHVTTDGGKSWTARPLGLSAPKIQGFAGGPFINEIPQAAVRFTDAGHGVVVLGLEGKSGMMALRTADGGKTWKEEPLPARFGAPYVSRDGKFLAVNKWNEGVQLLRYE